MTRVEVDKACGQTPCLCGEIDVWHPACYANKSAKQTRDGYAGAYRAARTKLKGRAQQLAATALAMAGAR